MTKVYGSVIGVLSALLAIPLMRYLGSGKAFALLSLLMALSLTLYLPITQVKLLNGMCI
ncbi:hypothetical protein [Oligella urethralis]|nr:hypothetical protein [Oligella urethralis]